MERGAAARCPAEETAVMTASSFASDPSLAAGNSNEMTPSGMKAFEGTCRCLFDVVNSTPSPPVGAGSGRTTRHCVESPAAIVSEVHETAKEVIAAANVRVTVLLVDPKRAVTLADVVRLGEEV
jgi:hypothetical protein